MSAFFLALSICGYVAFSHRRLSVDLGVAPLLSVSLIIIALYIGGIVGQLSATSNIVLFLGVALLPFAIINPLHRNNLYLLLVAAVGIVFAVKWFPDYRIWGGDEMSHWALVVKNIVAANALPTAETAIVPLFKAYPPGTALWQYFFIHHLGWSEAAMVFAQLILAVAALAAIAAAASHSHWLGPIAVLAICTALLYCFGFFLHQLMVDHILSLIFAAICVQAISTGAWTWRLATLAPMIAVLPLIKQAGLSLSFVSVAVCGVVVLFRQIQETSLYRAVVQAAVATGALTLFPALLYFSWGYHVIRIGAEDRSAAALDFNRFLEAIKSPTPRIEQVWQTLVDRLTTAPTAVTPMFRYSSDLAGIEFTASPMTLMLILLLISTIAIFANKRPDRLPVASGLIVIFLGAFAYLSLLVAAYFFWFSDYEAARLASFERYFGTYILAWAMVAVTVLVSTLDHRRRSVTVSTLALTVATIVLAPKPMAREFLHPASERTEISSRFLAERDKIETLYNALVGAGFMGRTFYFLQPGASAYGFHIFRYLIAPYSTQAGCHSVGARYHDRDLWSCNVPLPQALMGYDFLLLVDAGEEFWSRFGEYFDTDARGGAEGVFAITHGTSGEIVIRTLSE